ncbi:MAG: ABC transporter ATP-binding protein [Bacteroidales bacterium]|nr:ABC transporter ATP-binding protein [Deltaproteobacteria bacterium]MBL7137684.1 ABC transporter ATP-binding protein [Bacteroidales bacterium]
MTEESIIGIRDLTKYYKGADEPAIDHISLGIFKDEIFGFLGPNGAGKTTTISILCGLFPPTKGKVTIDGLDIRLNHEKIKHIIGIVPQEVALYHTLTGLENLQFFGNMYGLKGKALKERIGEYLVRFGLEKFARKQVSTYSGGMKRRVNLIAGLLHKPRILFLDEPTVGIDVQSRNVILEFLHELQETGTTIIYTSHYMEEAEKLCNRVAIIDQGKIIAIGNPKELVALNPEFKNLETMFLHLTGKGLRD